MAAGVTRSVRVPAGLPEKVMAATGMSFSEFVRVVSENAVRAFEANAVLRAQEEARDAEIAKLVSKELGSGQPS